MFSGGTTERVTVATVPVVARGAVKDSGTVVLNMNSIHANYKMSQGTIRTADTSGVVTTQMNTSTCQFTEMIRGGYIVTGGTGAYAHATGHGLYAAPFSVVLPRKANGKCNFASSAVPTSAVITIQAAGPIRIP